MGTPNLVSLAGTTATASIWHLQSCQWCGTHHAGICDRVKAIEYFPDGTIRRVEFHERPPAPVARRKAPPGKEA